MCTFSELDLDVCVVVYFMLFYFIFLHVCSFYRVFFCCVRLINMHKYTHTHAHTHTQIQISEVVPNFYINFDSSECLMNERKMNKKITSGNS